MTPTPLQRPPAASQAHGPRGDQGIPSVLMTSRPWQSAAYLTLVTLGFGLVLMGVSWLCEFGCTLVLCALLFVGRAPFQGHFTSLIAYLGLFVSFGGGVYQLITAHQNGHLWFRVPPPWWFVVFISAVWVVSLVKEFSSSHPPRH